MSEISPIMQSAIEILIYANKGDCRLAPAVNSFYRKGIKSPKEAIEAMKKAEWMQHKHLCDKYLPWETGADLNKVKAEGHGLIELYTQNILTWVNLKKAEFTRENLKLRRQFYKALKIVQSEEKIRK